MRVKRAVAREPFTLSEKKGTSWRQSVDNITGLRWMPLGRISQRQIEMFLFLDWRCVPPFAALEFGNRRND
jgi:hypothetical protein